MNKDVNVFIGKQLELARKEKGLSMTEVAEHFGMRRQRYFKYEKGERSMDIVTLVNVCEFLGIDINELMNAVKYLN